MGDSKADVDHVRHSEQAVLDEDESELLICLTSRKAHAQISVALFLWPSSPNSRLTKALVLKLPHETISVEGKAGQDASIMMKLADEDGNSLDKGNMQTLSDVHVFSHMQRILARHSISTPVSSALARGPSVLDYQKPGTSPLHNGIQCAPADDDELAQNESENPPCGIIVLNQPVVFRRATDQKGIQQVGMWAGAAKVGKPAGGTQFTKG